MRRHATRRRCFLFFSLFRTHFLSLYAYAIIFATATPRHAATLLPLAPAATLYCHFSLLYADFVFRLLSALSPAVSLTPRHGAILRRISRQPPPCRATRRAITDAMRHAIDFRCRRCAAAYFRCHYFAMPIYFAIFSLIFAIFSPRRFRLPLMLLSPP